MAYVSIVPCASYDPALCRQALLAVLEPIGGLDFARAGMTVGIKANLVAFMKPESAATTHPVLLAELTKLLRERGARVIVGDSPGGLFAAAYVKNVYRATGMHEVEAAYERGLIPGSVGELSVAGDLDGLLVKDFDNIGQKNDILFWHGGGVLERTLGKLFQACLRSRPKVAAGECIGCGKGFETCPAKAIEMKKQADAYQQRQVHPVLLLPGVLSQGCHESCPAVCGAGAE